MKSKIFLMLILIIQQLIILIPGKTQGDLCPLLGFKTDGITGSPDISAVKLKPPIPSSISTLPGGFSTVNFPISNSLKPTNTSAYDPATGDYVIIIAQEQKMLYYNGSNSSPILSTVPLSAPATAPVYVGGKIFAISVIQNTLFAPFIFDLVEISNSGTVNTIQNFSFSGGTFPFSSDIISSTTDGTNIYFGIGKQMIKITDILNLITNPTPSAAQIYTLQNPYNSIIIGFEYIGQNQILAILHPYDIWPNSPQELVMIDFNDLTNVHLNSVFPISQNIPVGPTGNTVNWEYYSTALSYTPCEQKYYITTLIESPYGTSYPFTRLIEIDINSGVATYNDIPGYLFGLEAETRNCCQVYPCEALVNQIKGQNIEFGKSIAVDKDGFIYTTGGFVEEAIFSSPCNLNLISQGDQDIYIAKHDPHTQCVNAVRIGNSGFDEGRGIALSEQGYVYVTGVYFNPTSGRQEAIVQKRKNDLTTLIWEKTFHSTTGLVNGNAITVDQNENVYVTGYFTGRGQFDGNSYLSYGESEDIFIARLSGADGSVNWVRRIGGDGEDYGKGIAVDHLGNVSVVGDFQYQLVVPYNLSIQLASNGGSRDIFLTRLNAAGDFHWVKNMGGISNDSGNAIAIDPSGDLYITGDFIYDPPFVGFSFLAGTPTSGGLYDAYVSKHSGNNGNSLWSAQLKGANSSVRGTGWSIALNKSGTRVYTTGIFNGLTDFDPSWANSNSLNPTGFEMFVSRLDASDGGFVDAFKLGPVPNTPGGFPEKYSNAIAVDKTGCVHTTGTFFGTVDFDPSPPPSNLLLSVSTNPYHYHDAFVHKFCCCCDDEENFHDLVNMGWQLSIDETNCEVTVTASQFSDCHYMTSLAPDWGDGSIGLPAFGPANGTWTHTYNDSGTYDICAWIVEMHNGVECWWAQICVQVEIECCPDSTSVSIPHSIVCTTDPTFTIPINCPTNCIVDRLEWFIKDVNATSFPTTPYQSIPGPNCAGLTILPGQFASFDGLHVYAVIYFDPASCCGTTQFTTNIATIKLCSPRFCTITNPNPEGFCEYGVPDPLILNFTGQYCGNPTVEWFYNGSLVSNSSQQYQPPPLEFEPGGPSDCYTEHKFLVILTGVCGINTCETSIFVYNPNSPLGVLEMYPDEDQPFCYGEDATLRYDHACAGIPPKWTWHSTTIDPPAITDYQIIPGAGTSNPVYNTNQLFETTWFMIEKQNGVCPEQHIQYKIEVLEPLVINDFQAVTNSCAEDWVNLSVDYSPSPLPLPQNADVHWYINGDLIGTSIASTSPVHYTFYYPGNIAGVYYAEILEYYCNQTIETPPVIIEPSCTPVVSGPCYRCFADTNPIVLTGDMVVPPGLPCPDISNCSFRWYEFDGVGNFIPIPGATNLIHISTDAGTFMLYSDCGGCQKWSAPHKVIQCDQTFSASDEPKGFLSVNIYPNPAMNEVNVRVMPAPDRNAIIMITDINGKTLKSTLLPANTDNVRINLNDIQAGFYLVHIYKDHRLLWINKLIITK